MALIICPECGRQISGKAAFCPGCGYPMANAESRNKSEYEKILDKIYLKYLSGSKTTSTDRANAIAELRKKSGVSKEKARDDLYIKAYGKTYPQLRKEKKQRDKAEKERLNQNLWQSLDTLSNLSVTSKIARCPKCHSTSISYQDKISLGRAAMGGLLAGSTGAVLGGLTGKKGYAVCLNCGKRWKV